KTRFNRRSQKTFTNNWIRRTRNWVSRILLKRGGSIFKWKVGGRLMSSWANLLAGKVAVVTGASRGLGRADALALAEAGADVIVTDILIESDEGNEKAAEKYGPIAQVMQSTDVIYTDKTVQEIKAMGRRSKAYKMDVTDQNQV